MLLQPNHNKFGLYKEKTGLKLLPPQEGLICNLDMENIVGSTVYDRSGNGYNATISNSSIQSGIKELNKSIYFNTSTASYCDISNLYLTNYNTFSINIWYKKEIGINTNIFMGGYYSSSSNTRYVSVSVNTNAITLGFRNNSSWLWSGGLVYYTEQDEKWHMVTAIRNGATNTLYLYLDGELATKSVDGAATESPSIIGNYPTALNGISGFRTGLFNHGQFLFYNRVLSAKEIGYLYNNGYGIK